jgi:hypothetical protein
VPTLDQPRIDDRDVARITEAFGLGSIRSVSYLTTGLMNRNWRITTPAGAFALKQVIDVPVPTARRNLRVLAALHQRGVPACPPVLTTDGDPVAEVNQRGYCLLPWLDGHHPAGPDLTLAQARQLGTVVGQIHDALNHLDPAIGLPATTPPAGRVVQPTTPLSLSRLTFRRWWVLDKVVIGTKSLQYKVIVCGVTRTIFTGRFGHGGSRLWLGRTGRG